MEHYTKEKRDAVFTNDARDKVSCDVFSSPTLLGYKDIIMDNMKKQVKLLITTFDTITIVSYI